MEPLHRQIAGPNGEQALRLERKRKRIRLNSEDLELNSQLIFLGVNLNDFRGCKRYN